MRPWQRAESDGRSSAACWGVTVAAGVAATLWLAGCSAVPDVINPISWYRDATGASKNDSKGQGESQDKLDAGSKEDYPNLAQVPPPPERAMSTDDREKLKESLIADRQNAHYTEEKLEAGAPVPGMVVPPPPPPVALPPAADASPSTTPGAATAMPSPAAATTASTPSPAPPASKKPAPVKASAAESSSDPAIPRPVPQGEEPTPPPPAPRTAAAAPPQQVAAAAAGTGQRTTARHQVADIVFTGASAEVATRQHGTLAEIAALQQRQGGKIQVVGYAQHGAAANPSSAEIDGFNLALDRAKAVAVALTELGVDSAKIAVEAAPVEATGEPRAEVFVDQ